MLDSCATNTPTVRPHTPQHTHDRVNIKIVRCSPSPPLLFSSFLPLFAPQSPRQSPGVVIRVVVPCLILAQHRLQKQQTDLGSQLGPGFHKGPEHGDNRKPGDGGNSEENAAPPERVVSDLCGFVGREDGNGALEYDTEAGHHEALEEEEEEGG